jgi:hypothetical protein
MCQKAWCDVDCHYGLTFDKVWHTKDVPDSPSINKAASAHRDPRTLALR